MALKHMGSKLHQSKHNNVPCSSILQLIIFIKLLKLILFEIDLENEFMGYAA